MKKQLRLGLYKNALWFMKKKIDNLSKPEEFHEQIPYVAWQYPLEQVQPRILHMSLLPELSCVMH